MALEKQREGKCSELTVTNTGERAELCSSPAERGRAEGNVARACNMEAAPRKTWPSLGPKLQKHPQEHLGHPPARTKVGVKKDCCIGGGSTD